MSDSVETTGSSRVLSASSGERLFVLGDDVIVKLSGKDTGGRFALFEIVTQAGAGPPPHIHANEDETFIVIEGEYEFLIGKETKRVKAGGIVFGPRAVPHTFKNVGSAPGRMYALCTPSGFEEFFRKVDRAVGRATPDMSKLTDIGRESGLTFLA